MTQGFAIIPRWLLYREGLSKHAKLAYAVIASHTNEDGEAWPSLGTIALEGSMARSSATAGVAELVALGVISRRPRFRKGGGKASSVYALTGLSAPVDNSNDDR